MKGNAQPLIKFFDGSDKRFVIPLYQRNYDWKEKHCRQLFVDLLKVHEKDKPSHFFGSIVSQIFHSDDRYIIDGQQRLTTVSLILLALVNGYKNRLNKDKEDANIGINFRDLNLPRKIFNRYLIDEYNDDERKIKLKPINKDMQAFDALVCGEADDYISDSNITRNYLYFYDQIQKSGLDGDDIFEAIKRLHIISILLDNDDDPQLIFESLNSTGLELSEADKVRNYLLMSIPVEEQQELYEKYWSKIEEHTNRDPSAFIRDFVTIKTLRIPRFDELYFAFKDFSEKTQLSRRKILIEMEKYSRLYLEAMSASTGMPRTDRRLRQINSLDAKVISPFYIAFFEYAKNNSIPDDECAEVLSVIESYMARRIVCNYSTSPLNKIFSRLHHDVINKSNSESVSRYSDILKYVLLKKSESAAFPTDEEFRSSFAVKQVYKTNLASRNFLLNRLENRDSEEAHDVVQLLKDRKVTIEHIMPQTLSQEWKDSLGDDYERIHDQYLHTMANLTLTSYNAEYSNLPFMKKKMMQNGFNDGIYRLSSYLRRDSTTKWTETEMIERRKELFDVCLNIWPYPTSKYEPIVKEVESASLDDEMNFTGKKLSGFVFLGTHYSVDTWKEMLRIVAQVCHQERKTTVLWCCANMKYSLSTVPSGGFDEFSKGLFIQTSNSTTAKIGILRELLKECDIPYSELNFEFSSGVKEGVVRTNE